MLCASINPRNVHPSAPNRQLYRACQTKLNPHLYFHSCCLSLAFLPSNRAAERSIVLCLCLRLPAFTRDPQRYYEVRGGASTVHHALEDKSTPKLAVVEASQRVSFREIGCRTRRMCVRGIRRKAQAVGSCNISRNSPWHLGSTYQASSRPQRATLSRAEAGLDTRTLSLSRTLDNCPESSSHSCTRRRAGSAHLQCRAQAKALDP